MEKIINALARELNIKPKQAEATVQLLDEGNTVPFIARYRKEATDSLDEEQIRTIEERLAYLRNLEQRRQEILTAIAAQEKLTPELEKAINAAEKMQALEDLYLPYRPKRRTRAQIARENGLEPLAQLIEEQGKPALPLEQLAAMHIDEEKGIATAEDAWQGACDIVAENISDSADVRKLLRKELQDTGELVSELIIDEKDAPEFLQYRDYSEPVRQMPPHRILAMNRGEDKKALKISLRCPDEKLIAKVSQKLNLREQSPFYTYYQNALTDSYKRLLLPSLERELRNELTEKAEKQAISVFAANLRQLLLTQPISGHTVLGLDPGYRTGCKTAVIDPNGRILATTAMYITGSKNQQEQAEKQFVELMNKYKITLIAIG
ncbi:MAG: RNA-binding transcriptional accessory protein, partial [Phascolarctobacterium sp.]|nr:RNA-binding transcriptional accessory protein [Phascolarctobacterium sp.]